MSSVIGYPAHPAGDSAIGSSQYPPSPTAVSPSDRCRPPSGYPTPPNGCCTAEHYSSGGLCGCPPVSGLLSGSPLLGLSPGVTAGSMYPGLEAAYPSAEMIGAIHPSMASYSLDPYAVYPYLSSYAGIDARRKNTMREATNTLKAWLYEHRKNPYPTKGEKIMLAILTKMTLTQVSTWFANARRRLKKDNKVTWDRGDEDEDEDDNGKEDSDREREITNLDMEDDKLDKEDYEEDVDVESESEKDLERADPEMRLHEKLDIHNFARIGLPNGLDISSRHSTLPCTDISPRLESSSSMSSSSLSLPSMRDSLETKSVIAKSHEISTLCQNSSSTTNSPYKNTLTSSSTASGSPTQKPKIWSIADVVRPSNKDSKSRHNSSDSERDSGSHGRRSTSPEVGHNRYPDSRNTSLNLSLHNVHPQSSGPAHAQQTLLAAAYRDSVVRQPDGAGPHTHSSKLPYGVESHSPQSHPGQPGHPLQRHPSLPNGGAPVSLSMIQAYTSAAYAAHMGPYVNGSQLAHSIAGSPAYSAAAIVPAAYWRPC